MESGLNSGNIHACPGFLLLPFSDINMTSSNADSGAEASVSNHKITHNDLERRNIMNVGRPRTNGKLDDGISIVDSRRCGWIDRNWSSRLQQYESGSESSIPVICLRNSSRMLAKSPIEFDLIATILWRLMATEHGLALAFLCHRRICTYEIQILFVVHYLATKNILQHTMRGTCTGLVAVLEAAN
ncbi:hypothetical protein CIHG_06613 [Coccidioides immitis H538.4]|uniref:Uncharacterized protein n=3 Tax=Coccidioides immitis TaxID=5501 RepID=A0A0J8TFH8_COCIT|nr:hypothetical protein CIRG_08029 [Coccidioides immitis RMSCC 2394]KMU72392.1 hypothetical protein CISG_03040 [Coccidioides immitis RMSCC 3703]KMU88672.1 hypothetical protein CIHG_06613 [Coccidioides immitis H538.4]